MKEPSFAVDLQDITSLGRLGRAVAASELWRARRKTPHLARELPYPDIGYRNPLSAYRRLNRIAQSAAEHSLRACLIVCTGVDIMTIGMATAQKAEPSPNPLEDAVLGRGGIELSYWHQAHPLSNVIGFQVMRKLLDTRTVPEANGNEVIWTVTLPDDANKANVLEVVGFDKVGDPKVYDLADGVYEPRQLWTREQTLHKSA